MLCDRDGDSSADTNDTYPRVKIHLRSLYTGEPHPLASNPILDLYDMGTPSHSIKCQIMGDTIGILFARWGGSPTPLIVWKWTTGEMLSVRSSQLCTTDFLIPAPQYTAFSDLADVVSFTFVSDHTLIVPLHDVGHGPCLHYYNFEPVDCPIRFAGVSTYVPRIDAIFSLPLDEDVYVVGAFGLEIGSEAPVLSPQPCSSRRAGITRHTPLPRKFHTRHGSPLITMRFACAYSEENEDSDKHLILAAYASAFTDLAPRDTTIPWTEWRDSARLVLDGLGTQTAAHQGNEFECNVSADRIVVIDRHDASATVRVMDFNPIRLRSAGAASSGDRVSHNRPGITFDGTSVVEKAPYDSDCWIELASRGVGRGVGMAFVETTMPKVFSSMSGTIILEEHLLVMTRVSSILLLSTSLIVRTNSSRLRRGPKVIQLFMFLRCKNLRCPAEYEYPCSVFSIARKCKMLVLWLPLEMLNVGLDIYGNRLRSRLVFC